VEVTLYERKGDSFDAADRQTISCDAPAKAAR
jgi:hypothetical protein